MSIKTFTLHLTGLLIVALMIGCGGPERNSPRGGGGAADSVGADGAGGLAGDRRIEPAGAARDIPSPEAGVAEAPATVLFIGTSLTAGLGVAESQSFPRLIERRIEEAGLPFRVVNAGVSGETSAGALRRVDWLLRQPFDVAVIETGANDMLRGVDPASTERNIQEIIDRIREVNPDTVIVLAGMLALPNMGEVYGREFQAIYPRLAQRNDLPFIPFLLDGVGGERDLNQDDGVHPNAEGHRVMADTVWRVLEPGLVERAAADD